MATRSQPSEITGGDIVGDEYRVEYKIGEGGFGDVWRAEELESERSVAIKTLRQHENAELPDLVQRFEREFALAAKLRHPHIVEMHDFGQLPSGTLYMVMEYVPGEELEKVLRREGRLQVERAGQIVLQVLDALNAAHEVGVVHRDLKPSNVMLTRVGLKRDVVKLLDFGVAKAFDGTYADLTAQNLSGSVGFGTPQYMAPEQIYGQDIGPHTDLYAVALIYIELVTGKAPMLADSPTDIIQKQIEEEVPIPAWLERSPIGSVLERALQKDWRKRYVSAADLYFDLEEALAGKTSRFAQPKFEIDDPEGPPTQVVDGHPFEEENGDDGEFSKDISSASPDAIQTMLVSSDGPTIAEPTHDAPTMVTPNEGMSSNAPTQMTRPPDSGIPPAAGPVSGAPPITGPTSSGSDGIEVAGLLIPTPLVILAVTALAFIILMLVIILAS